MVVSPLLVLVSAALVSTVSTQVSDYDMTPPVVGSVGGWNPVIHEYPWLVGVYRTTLGEGKSEPGHICGGSLVQESIVLSAAHCFWNNGDAIPLDEYYITGGNYYRNITFNEEKQIFKVQGIKLHERYRDHELNYAHDIAIVYLVGKANTELLYINPIAIDWNIEFVDTQLTGQSGVVVGWGFTDNNRPSEARVAVNLPYVDFDTCWKTVPRQFRVFVTPDKFCAGHRNGTAVCPGDSGGGLAFKDPQTNIWYLRGIVSVGVAPEGEDNCFKTQFSAFTSIAVNYLWLKNNLLSSKIETTDNSSIAFPDDYD